VAHAYLPNLFFDLFPASKLDQCCPSCLGGRESVPEFEVDEHFQMGIDFLCELPVSTVSVKQIFPEAEEKRD
jgi:hypothetical protein